MSFRNVPSKTISNKTVPRVASLSSIGLAFCLSLALILNGFISLEDVLQEYGRSQVEQQAAAASALINRGKNTGTDVINKQALVSTDRIIVKFKDGTLPNGLTAAAQRANLEKAEGLKKLLTINGVNADVYQVPQDSTAQEVIDRLMAKSKDAVEYAEIDMLVPAALNPNDQYFSSQWHHTNIKSPAAWDKTLGSGVTVAVLDTGVDANHSDLVFSDQPGWNFYDNNSNTADVQGHGTAVAGSAAALGNNTIGVSGVAPQAKILPIRISDPQAYAYFSAMASGITYAADHGARVANISYSGTCGSSAVWNAANYMRSKGGVVIAAAGNTGADNLYPASPVITCVSATGSNDLRTSWSSWGIATDVAAPGAGIYTTLSGGGYGAVSGTSFSSPITAGIYGLLFSINPKLTPDQADNILFSTATDIGPVGWDVNYGYGLVNIEKAVALASSTIGAATAPDTTAPTIPANFKTTNVTSNSVALSWNASTDNKGVTGYSVYQAGAKIASVSGTIYTNSGLTPETAYAYVVRAEDAAGNQSADSSTVSTKTTPVPFAINSQSISTKTATTAVASISLTKPGTVVIKYGTSASALSSTVQSTTANTAHTLNISGLAAGTTYYYQVTAVGEATVTSAISSFKTPRLSTTGRKR